MTGLESAIPAATVAIVGAGTMGLAIANLLAGRGHTVRLYDAFGIKQTPGKGVVECAELAECVSGADVVFEAIIEDLSAKQALLRQIQELAGPVVVASNTSTLRPSQLADGLNLPEAVLVAHFFNPADVVPLVEVVPGPETNPAAVDIVRAILVDAGKVVVSLDHEVDGFVANRLQAALVREALSLVRSGVASAEDVDAAVVHGIGPRWAISGPFEVLDRGGLDVWQAVTSRLFPLLSNESEVPQEISSRVAAGHLGLKAGRGFYSYEDATTSPFSRLEDVLAAASPLES